MADEQWVPFSKRGDAVAAAEFLEFIPGLDGRRKTLVVKWLTKRGEVLGYPYDRTTCGLLERFIDAAAPDLEATQAIRKTTGEWGEFFAGMGEQSLLDFFDYALHEIRTSSSAVGYAREIEKSLENAHSIYGVGERDGRYCVIERVDPGVQTAVKKVVKDSGTAGDLLSRAWGKVYALHPDASGAYEAAVKAVETAGASSLAPGDDEPSLGKMYPQLKNQHDSAKSEWTFALRNRRDETKPVHQVVGMMELLWRGHLDRHGSEVYEDVSLDEARAAVLLAATLVGWLNAGYLVKA